MKTAFLDSSVLFTAVNSPTGGSAKLFTLNIKLVASKVVLVEVERNVSDKLKDYHLDRFFMLVNQLQILDQIPDDELITQAKKVIAECDFLVTLDQKHFLTLKAKEFLKPKKILSPKMLIKILEK